MAHNYRRRNRDWSRRSFEPYLPLAFVGKILGSLDSVRADSLGSATASKTALVIV
jgi:hypothetical protein